MRTERPMPGSEPELSQRDENLIITPPFSYGCGGQGVWSIFGFGKMTRIWKESADL